MKTIKYIDVGSHMPRSKAIKKANVKEEDIVWDYQILEQLRKNPILLKDAPQNRNIATRPCVSRLVRLDGGSWFNACDRSADYTNELVRGVVVWVKTE